MANKDKTAAPTDLSGDGVEEITSNLRRLYHMLADPGLNAGECGAVQ